MLFTGVFQYRPIVRGPNILDLLSVICASRLIYDVNYLINPTQPSSNPRLERIAYFARIVLVVDMRDDVNQVVCMEYQLCAYVICHITVSPLSTG